MYFLTFLSPIISDTECPNILNVSLNDGDGDRRLNKTSSIYKIMQYNVQWLFIDYYENAKCPGSGCDWINISEAEIHLDHIAKVIKKIDPDIINFCEVEGCDELNILISTIGNNEYKQYLKEGTDTSTGQNVAMITKIDPISNLYRVDDKIEYPIEGSTCGYNGTSSTTSVSKHYITEFLLNNIKIVMISAHLIAKPTDIQRCAQREGQAQILQEIIFKYYNNDYEIIMIGDFNDFDAEIMDLNNNKPISQTLNILKGISGIYKGKYELKPVSELIPQNYRFTNWYDKIGDCKTILDDFSMIDHILLTPFLHNKILNAYIYHEYQEFCGKYNSDHYPIIIEIQL
jgi:exonuclease III